MPFYFIMEALRVIECTIYIHNYIRLANQKDLVLACDSGELEVWRCERPGHTLSAIASLGCHDDMVLVVRQLAEDHLLVSGGGDGKYVEFYISLCFARTRACN